MGRVKKGKSSTRGFRSNLHIIKPIKIEQAKTISQIKSFVAPGLGFDADMEKLLFFVPKKKEKGRDERALITISRIERAEQISIRHYSMIFGTAPVFPTKGKKRVGAFIIVGRNHDNKRAVTIPDNEKFLGEIFLHVGKNDSRMIYHDYCTFNAICKAVDSLKLTNLSLFFDCETLFHFNDDDGLKKKNLRPDAIYRKNDILYCIETDMGRESLGILTEKASAYRKLFLRKRELQSVGINAVKVIFYSYPMRITRVRAAGCFDDLGLDIVYWNFLSEDDALMIERRLLPFRVTGTNFIDVSRDMK